MDQGLLDLSVELSTRDITAGNEFALFVLVKSPFSSPVWIYEVNVILPSELKLADEETILNEAKQSEAKFESRLRDSQEDRLRIGQSLTAIQAQLSDLKVHLSGKHDSTNNIQGLIQKLGKNAESLQDALARITLGSTDIRISGSEVNRIKVGSEATTLKIDSDGVKPSIVNQIEVYAPWLVQEERIQARTVRLMSSLPDNAALQPGSTVVYRASLNVKKSLIFTPSQYRLQFYVNYSFSQKTMGSGEESVQLRDDIFTNTIAHKLSIRPSVYSVLIGSILGGLTGSVARLLQLTSPTTWRDSLVSILVTTILSAIAVIFMARKSDTQSFVSIEDFWGGLLIGFLVGYTGTSFFESLTGVGPPKVVVG